LTITIQSSNPYNNNNQNILLYYRKGTKSLKTMKPESISEFTEISEERGIRIGNACAITRLDILQEKAGVDSAEQGRHAMKLKRKQMEENDY
jgi:hypothetical protein